MRSDPGTVMIVESVCENILKFGSWNMECVRKRMLVNSGKCQDFWVRVAIGVALCGLGQAASGQEPRNPDLPSLVQVIKQVDAEGRGHTEAMDAMRRLGNVSSADIPLLLAAMDDANPLACNWLRNLVEQAATSEEFPSEGVLAFLRDITHGARARRLAYELLLARDPATESRLLPTMLQDPSPELRWDAVRFATLQAEPIKEPEQKLAALLAALDASRDAIQTQAILSQLTTLGKKIDLNEHFAMIAAWEVLGPFDSAGRNGFTTTYPPESEQPPEPPYAGKEGPISWKSVVTTKKEAIVDLNESLGKHKDAVAYARAEF
ncbi:MAG TPA: hypothetical protein VIY86_05480, partial [Pirellulaceae bacterium]